MPNSNGLTTVKRIELPVLDKAQLGEFIGRGGTNIKFIEKQQRVIIRLATEGEVMGATITGSTFDVERAILMIEEHAMLIRSRQFVHSVRIPKDFIGYVIGRKGAYFQQIRDRSNTKLSIDQEDSDTLATISIKGNFPGIMMACDMLYDRLTSVGKSREEDRFENLKKRAHFMDDWGEVNDEQYE